jgi:hypothetical protein
VIRLTYSYWLILIPIGVLTGAAIAIAIGHARDTRRAARVQQRLGRRK